MIAPLLLGLDDARAGARGTAPRASTCTSGTWKWSRNADTTCSASFFRIRPWSTKHAGQPLAERAVDDQRRDRGVDAARQPADRAAVADLRADQRDLLVDDRGRRPARRSQPQTSKQEVLQDRRCRAACARPRGGTGSRRGRASGTRAPRPARRATKPARRSPAAARRPCRGGSSSTSARPAGPPADGRARARAARCGRTPPPRPARRGRRAPAPSPASRNRCRAPARPARAARGAARARPPRRRGGAAREHDPARPAAPSSSTGTSCGSSSEKTPHSRIRRAISCEYWPPKSSTRTSSRGRPAARPPRPGGEVAVLPTHPAR